MDHKRPKLLVVDDDPKNIYAMKHIVEPLDLDVVESLSGEEALRSVLHNDFFLVLMDVQMPDMNGFETATLILKNRTTAHLPIIFVTAINKEERFALKGYQTGAVDYIFKPVDPKILISKINVFKKLWSQWVELQQSNFELVDLNRKLLSTSKALEESNCQLKKEVAERVLTEQALRAAREEADFANRSKSEFLANMSHEIRTPLNGIVGMTNLALQTQLNAKQSNFLSKIKTSSDTLLNIINDILDFSKIEAGRLELENDLFNLNDVLENLAYMMAVKAEEKGLELLVDFRVQLPLMVTGDSLRLGQILLNLLNNAIKFTVQGDVMFSVEVVEVNGSDMKIRFQVLDTGIGMTSEQIENIFRPFHQGDSSTTRKYGGTGLGLVISKRLVEQMGGSIKVESEAGVGSTFSFTLTFKNNCYKPIDYQVPSPEYQGLRILVVEDHKATSKNMMRMLEVFSFHGTAVASGEEALCELMRVRSDAPYDVVLLDWKMPGIDGLETARRIKNDLELPESPAVILITAYGSDEVCQEADKLEMEGVLYKPVTSSMLFAAILAATGANPTGLDLVSKPLDLGVELVRGIQGDTILLVDDDDINQEIAKELLLSAGLKVTVVTNGKEAVEILQESLLEGGRGFDAVLMDCQMPVMDGFEASRIIRSNAAFEQMPIIAMTANALVGDREKCLSTGMNDHVSKPINPRELFGVLAQWIKEKDKESR